jgi:hypothetical protein
MMVYVIVERSYEEPIETEGLETRMEANPWCLEQYRVTYLRSFISTDGKRMLCLFEGPDAESVRHVNRQLDAGYERIWSATMHEPLP